MNILILTYQGDLAGSTYSISFLAKGLAERGHTVVVGCRRESLLYRLLENTAVVRYPMTFRNKTDRENMRQIRDAVFAHNIQIINAQSSKDRYTSILARWRYRLPVKVVHTRRQTPKSAGGWLQRMFYLRGTDKFVVISHQLKKTFVEKGFPARHIEVIYNGMQPDFFENASSLATEKLRLQYNFSLNDKIIGCISRLKRQEQLIEALQWVNPDVKVLFVGIPTNYFDELAAKYQLQHTILYAGTVNREEIVNYYPLFNVFVLPSDMDGFGLVLVEAMGMGVPVVGTHHEGIIDVLKNGKNGLLYENGNTRQLANCINVLLYDDEAQKRFIEAGKIAAHHTFTVKTMIEHYEVFFQTLISSK